MPRKGRDIEERAFRFACEVVLFCDRNYGSGRVLQRLLNQLVDAATSVGANLEEAAAGQTKADFVAKTCVAQKEAREACYWLRMIMTTYPQYAPLLSPLAGESTQILAIVSTIVRNARVARE